MSKGIFKTVMDRHIVNRLIVSIILILTVVSFASAAQNPAAQLCAKKGNSYEKHIDMDGSEYGLCVLKDSTKVDAWQYYREHSGKDKSPILTIQANGKKINKHFLTASESLPSNNLIISAPVLSAAAATSFDWRSKSSQNYVTSVKDQGSCGACWAFTTEAAVESKTRINLNFSGYNIDLSEQDLISCSGAGNCIGGNNKDALDYIKATGVVSESSFPYTATDSSCSNKKSNNGITKAGYALLPNNANAIKEAISTVGPVIIYLGVCGDFQSYTGGIYSHSGSMLNDMSCWTYVDGQGYYLNSHTMILVGYSDAGQYWIAKNSWGKGWGEAGYIRISYSQNVEDSVSWFDDLNNNPYSTESRILFLDDSYKITTTDSNADGKSDTDFLSPLKIRVTNDTLYYNYSTNSKTNYTMMIASGSSKIIRTDSAFYSARTGIINSLKSNTTYRYNITACDSSKNCHLKSGTIKTLANTPVLKISNLKARAKNDTISINFSINMPANYTLILTGGNSKYTKYNSAFNTFWNVVFSGLKANTTYQFNLTVCDSTRKCKTMTGTNKTLVNQRQNNINIIKVNSSRTAITFNFASSYPSNYTLTLTSGTSKFVKSNSNFLTSRILTFTSLKANTTYNYLISICDSTRLCSQKTGQKKTLA